MKKIILIPLAIFFCSSLSAQINMEDSTSQIVGYWDKNEKQVYTITQEKYKVTNSDTIDRSTESYEVEITIKDSTEKSYTIEWFYKNFKMDTDVEILKRIEKLSKDFKVTIKTNELGVFTEVVNWKEIRDYIKKTTDEIANEIKDKPEVGDMIKNLAKLYSSKEVIESSGIREILQFYSFHGAKYKLKEELSQKVKLQNNFGGSPFDAEVTVVLDEINEKDNNSVLRMWQTVDSKQLTEATYKFMKSLGKDVAASVPSKDDMPEIKNVTSSAARIHTAGWVIYSVETKQTTASNTVNVEERTIEIE